MSLGLDGSFCSYGIQRRLLLYQLLTQQSSMESLELALVNEATTIACGYNKNEMALRLILQHHCRTACQDKDMLLKLSETHRSWNTKAFRSEAATETSDWNAVIHGPVSDSEGRANLCRYWYSRGAELSDLRTRWEKANNTDLRAIIRETVRSPKIVAIAITNDISGQTLSKRRFWAATSSTESIRAVADFVRTWRLQFPTTEIPFPHSETDS